MINLIKDLEMKCGFCKFFQLETQNEGKCVLNPPQVVYFEEDGFRDYMYADITVKCDRRGCQFFKFEQGFLHPDKKEKK